MPDTHQLSINLATVRMQWDLRQAVDGVAAAGIPAIAPWRDQIAAVGLAGTTRLIRDAGLRVSGLCRGGLFPAADAAGREAAHQENLAALDEALAIGAECIVLVAGGLPDGSKDIAGARTQVEEGLARLLEAAQAAGMRLALEPLHPMYAADRACVNTLAQALDICERVGGSDGASGLGVAIDVYHTWWDPDVAAGIARAGRSGRIFAYHICDWLVPTRDLLLDRGMMGDGVIDLPAFRAMVEAEGYGGLHEVEIFSTENWWKRAPEEVLKIAIERHRTVT